VEGEVLRDLAIFLPGEDEFEVLIVSDWAVGVVVTERFLGESFVVILDELRRIGAG
jgi:hypothetical protein